MAEDKIVVGLWDCPYCQTKAINGLKKHCPCCGHPQDDGTRFYMGKEIIYVDEADKDKYGKGADWVCPYCKSLNPQGYQYCSNCGGPKEESEEDYFNKKKEEPTVQPVTESVVIPWYRKYMFLILLGAIGLLFFFLGRPKKDTFTIMSKSWQRSIAVEELTEVEDSAWNVPSDAKEILREEVEIHHYDRIFDHTEMRIRQVAERVYDGEDTSVEYIDNGDGTFTEHTISTPRYRTEYHDETYEEQIYRNDPVYATKYYYLIPRWIGAGSITTSGEADEPYWPELTSPEIQRECDRAESYQIHVKDKKGRELDLKLPYDFWSTLLVGDNADITYKGAYVEKLNGNEVGR